MDCDCAVIGDDDEEEEEEEEKTANCNKAVTILFYLNHVPTHNVHPMTASQNLNSLYRC